MKSKTPLALIEMSVMVLIFALAAAVCVRTFVRADGISNHCADRDRAVAAVENAAETVKYYRGDLEQAALILEGSADGKELSVEYGPDWTVIPGNGQFRLIVTEAEDSGELLGTAGVRVVRTEDGAELFAVTTAWQKAAD